MIICDTMPLLYVNRWRGFWSWGKKQRNTWPDTSTASKEATEHKSPSKLKWTLFLFPLPFHFPTNIPLDEENLLLLPPSYLLLHLLIVKVLHYITPADNLPSFFLSFSLFLFCLYLYLLSVVLLSAKFHCARPQRGTPSFLHGSLGLKIEQF